MTLTVPSGFTAISTVTANPKANPCCFISINMQRYNSFIFFVWTNFFTDVVSMMYVHNPVFSEMCLFAARTSCSMRSLFILTSVDSTYSVVSKGGSFNTTLLMGFVYPAYPNISVLDMMNNI